MTRTFWMAVGALGGIAAYRKSVKVANRARELGPLGSAQAIASGAGRAADRTANGLGRVIESRERRAGRLLSGTATDRTGLPAGQGIPADWSPLPDLGSAQSRPANNPRNATPRTDGQ